MRADRMLEYSCICPLTCDPKFTPALNMRVARFQIGRQAGGQHTCTCPPGLTTPVLTCLSLQVDSFEREVMELVKPSHGTTTLAFIFEGGVIVAVDSRASMGSYICAPLLPPLLPSLHLCCTGLQHWPRTPRSIHLSEQQD